MDTTAAQHALSSNSEPPAQLLTHQPQGMRLLEAEIVRETDNCKSGRLPGTCLPAPTEN